jgi:hypothetical protein
LAERQPSKLNVASSNLVSRSNTHGHAQRDTQVTMVRSLVLFLAAVGVLVIIMYVSTLGPTPVHDCPVGTVALSPCK